MLALDTARSAGASYADVRLSHTRERRTSMADTGDDESMEVGVRALVDGYWGFASGAVWSPDEMARLGREAVHQAKVNALGKPRVVRHGVGERRLLEQPAEDGLGSGRGIGPHAAPPIERMFDRVSVRTASSLGVPPRLSLAAGAHQRTGPRRTAPAGPG